MDVRLVTAAAGAGTLGWINELSVTLLNVPVNTIALASAGALLSYAYEGSPEHTEKKRFYFSVLANVFTACALVSVVPPFLGWEWYDMKMQGSVAFLFALAARFAIPFFFKMMPEIIRRWFRIGEYKDAESSRESWFDRNERLPDDFK